MHIYEVLQSVYGILMTLEVRDAVDPLSTLKFWTDPESSKKEVVQYVCLPSPPRVVFWRVSTESCITRSGVLPTWTVGGISAGFLNRDRVWKLGGSLFMIIEMGRLSAVLISLISSVSCMLK